MVIRVYGMPAWLGTLLPGLAEDLKRSVSCVPEAHVEPSSIRVFFPNEMAQQESGKELLIYVDTEKKEAGYALNSVGQAVGATLREFVKVRLLSCRAIDVLVRPVHSGDELIAYSL
ncbi:MAG: hypothetical protein HY735_30380 [Verrucomicrobia bacterium]|nr:hypothetical protein [Verrucomicrobiota bacterium]